MTNEELVCRIKEGIDVSQNMLALWQQNRNFIHTIARHYQRLTEIEDLEQEGYLALYEAVDGFSPEAGCQFLTYAKYRIVQRMKRYIENCCGMVRIPVHEQSKMHQLRMIERAFLTHHGRRPTEEEIIQTMNLTRQQIKDLQAAMRLTHMGSLDCALTDAEEGDTLGTLVAGDTDVEADVLDDMEAQQLAKALWEAVDALPAPYREIIHGRYAERKTVKEMSDILHLSPGKTGRMEKKAIQELREERQLVACLPDWMETQAYRHNSVAEFNRTWESATERAAFKLL